ncbi:MAG: hypothetical protein CM1200mP10_09970 [Candidatus Neomarinimicrobiota bacterium]|nr:MAG: hypothetical protein CM1200mP10_09970 [Candidatus Neomarinimicrobiota bacterium]
MAMTRDDDEGYLFLWPSNRYVFNRSRSLGGGIYFDETDQKQLLLLWMYLF